MPESGFLLVDKPVDWTSHDVVGYLRGVTGIKKIGHAGTLDPFATGLLIVGVGREATKRLDEFKGMQKQYTATVQLGATSNTQDLTGTIQQWSNETVKPITKADIQQVLSTFHGKQRQIPPMFSAKKVKGKKLYELARKGQVIERQPVDIEIFNIELGSVIASRAKQSTGWKSRLLRRFTPRNDNNVDSFDIRVSCSTGTYIRTLCHDIGQTLGTGAYCSALRRTYIGDYSVEDATLPKSCTQENWRSLLTNI